MNTALMAAPDDFKTQVGDAVRRARNLRGLSQADLATKAGLRPATISDIERGVNAPDIETAWNLADVLGLPLDAILGRATQPASSPFSAETAARLTVPEGQVAAAIGALQEQVDSLSQDHARLLKRVEEAEARATKRTQKGTRAS